MLKICSESSHVHPHTHTHSPLPLPLSLSLSLQGARFITEYTWDFGDSTNITSIGYEQSRVQAHTYSKPGDFILTVVATNEGGEASVGLPISVLGRLPGIYLPPNNNNNNKKNMFFVRAPPCSPSHPFLSLSPHCTPSASPIASFSCFLYPPQVNGILRAGIG